MIINPHWPVPLGRKPIDLGLGRMMQLMLRLGNPHLKLPPVVHVAGTNGKGSTIAFLRALLEEAGLKVHVYSSPHLIYFNERIRLVGKLVEDAMLTDALERCRIATEIDNLRITFFEGTTAAAFLLMAEVEADIVLLETGLGGRLDATNIIPNPALTIITPISMDHKEFLGDTVAAIAFEKSGIIKYNVPCIVAPQELEALEIIEHIASENDAPVYYCSRDWQVDNTLKLGLPGEHQAVNAGAALAALPHLKVKLTDAQKQAALLKVEWPARMQRLHGGLEALLPPGSALWLDGGHNPAAGHVIADALKNWHGDIFVIIGMLVDKEADLFIQAFAPYITAAWCVPIPNEPKCRAVHDLQAIVTAHNKPAFVAHSVRDALSDIAAQHQNPCQVLICGSLYLAGSVLAEHTKLV